MKSVFFSTFGLFLLSPRLIFPFLLGQVLNYWASFSLFWVGFSSQHLLGLLNFFFFLKTRVIKLLIIYLILKINKYINIERECGAVQFVRFSYYKTANRTAPCGAVRLCHFAGGFGAVFAVYAVWWTPIHRDVGAFLN